MTTAADARGLSANASRSNPAASCRPAAHSRPIPTANALPAGREQEKGKRANTSAACRPSEARPSIGEASRDARQTSRASAARPPDATTPRVSRRRSAEMEMRPTKCQMNYLSDLPPDRRARPSKLRARGRRRRPLKRAVSARQWRRCLALRDARGQTRPTSEIYQAQLSLIINHPPRPPATSRARSHPADCSISAEFNYSRTCCCRRDRAAAAEANHQRPASRPITHLIAGRI